MENFMQNQEEASGQGGKKHWCGDAPVVEIPLLKVICIVYIYVVGSTMSTSDTAFVECRQDKMCRRKTRGKEEF